MGGQDEDRPVDGPEPTEPAATFEPSGRVRRARAWRVPAALLTLVLANSFPLRAALTDGPYWTREFGLYLLGLGLLWIVAVSWAMAGAGQVRLTGTTLAGARGGEADLSRARVRLFRRIGARRWLWLRLTAGSLWVDLTDPDTGVLRSADELDALAEALRRTGAPAHAEIADLLTALARHGLVAALEPEPADQPEPFGPATPSPWRSWGRLFYGGIRMFVGTMIMIGVWYYVVSRVAASWAAGGPSGEELLGHVGVLLLFTLSGYHILRAALADLLTFGGSAQVVGDTVRRGPRRRSVRACDSELIVVGGQEMSLGRFAARWRTRPVLRVAAPGRRPLHLDLAHRDTGDVLPAADLYRLADAVAAAGRPGADRTARQLRELAGHRRVRPASWLFGPLEGGFPFTPADDPDAAMPPVT